MSNTLSILNKDIRTLNGMYSLNDLHKASGGENKNSPRYWVQNKQTNDLIKEIEKDGNPSFLKKQGLGTFACVELICDYASWISAQFHLHVIRTFLKAQNQQPNLESPYITDEQLDHIKRGVGKVVKTTGKHWQAAYRELFEHVGAPTVREIKKQRYGMACAFLGIPTNFEVPADTMALSAQNSVLPIDKSGYHRYLVATDNGEISHINEVGNRVLAKSDDIRKLMRDMNILSDAQKEMKNRMNVLFCETSKDRLDNPIMELTND